MLVTASEVVVALVNDAFPAVNAVVEAFVIVANVLKRLPAVSAVDDAYGNCDAATVDDEKKTPCVRIEVDVDTVEVPNEFTEPNGQAKVTTPRSDPVTQLPFCAKQPLEILKPTLDVEVAEPFTFRPLRVVVPKPPAATERNVFCVLPLAEVDELTKRR